MVTSIEKQKFIVFRQYFTGLFWTYERVELEEGELGEYLENNYKDLDKIDVFTKQEKVNVELKINLRKEEG